MMKKHFLFLVAIFFFTGKINAQEQSALDLLKAPSSPGFILLDKQPTDIERPVTPTDFMVSFRNAATDIGGLPKNYAVELPPFWLFGGKKISFSDLTDTTGNFGKTFKQTFTLSLAIGSDEVENISQTHLGFGAKFSILRGNKISDEFLKANKERMNTLRDIETDFHSDEGYKKIKAKYKAIRMSGTQNTDLIDAQESLETDAYQNSRLDGLQSKYDAQLKKLSETKLQRYGWFLDLAGGMVTDFPNMVFDSATVPKYGGWLTLTHEGKKDFTFLVVAREFFQMNESYTATDDVVSIANLNHTDAGIRLIIDKSKFTFSLEGLFRMTGGADDMLSENKSGWKMMMNTSYDLGNNKIITFNMGRDFNGTVTKGGNVIAALNLILGFGNKRNIAN